jgi:hypothetical protein
MFYSTGPWRESPIVVCQKGFDKWEEGAPLKTQSRAPHFLPEMSIGDGKRLERRVMAQIKPSSFPSSCHFPLSDTQDQNVIKLFTTVIYKCL